MRFFNTEYHFGNVPLRNGFSEHIVANKKTKEVPAWHVIHDEVQIVEILKACDQWDNPVKVSSYVVNDKVEHTTESLQQPRGSHVPHEDDPPDCF
jgi:hypothetical protein